MRIRLSRPYAVTPFARSVAACVSVCAFMVAALLTAAPGQEPGSRLVLASKAPGAVTLKPLVPTERPEGVTDIVGGSVGLTVANDSFYSGPLSVSLLLDDGRRIPLAKPGAELEAGTASKPAVMLLSDAGEPAVEPRASTRLRLTLRVRPAPTEALSGTLGIRAGRDVSPLSVPISAESPNTERFTGARFSPAKVNLHEDWCWPLGVWGDCPPPAPQEVRVSELSPGAELPTGHVVAEEEASGDNGGRARARLTVVKTIGAEAEQGTLKVEVNGITESSTYTLELSPDPSDDEAPKLEANVEVRDAFFWSLIPLFAGSGVAYLLFVRRNKKRPSEVLQLAIADASKSYRAARKSTKKEPPYTLDEVFHGDDTWDCGAEGNGEAVKLYCEAGNAQNQDDLDRITDEVTDLKGRVAAWPQSVAVWDQLNQKTADLRAADPTLSSALVELCEKQGGVDPPDDVEATESYKATVTQLVDACDQWLAAHKLYLAARDLYNIVETLELDPDERRALEGLHPEAVAVELSSASLEDLIEERTLLKVRDGVRMLTALKATNRDQVRSLLLRHGLMLEDIERRPEVEPSPEIALAPPKPERVERPLADRLRVRLILGDRFDFWITYAITTGLYFVGIYVTEDGFSSWEQYAGAFLAGAAGELAIDWKLLPFFRSRAVKSTAAE